MSSHPHARPTAPAYIPERPAYDELVEDADAHQVAQQVRPGVTLAETAEAMRTLRRRGAEGRKQLAAILAAMIPECRRVLRPAQQNVTEVEPKRETSYAE